VVTRYENKNAWSVADSTSGRFKAKAVVTRYENKIEQNKTYRTQRIQQRRTYR